MVRASELPGEPKMCLGLKGSGVCVGGGGGVAWLHERLVAFMDIWRNHCAQFGATCAEPTLQLGKFTMMLLAVKRVFRSN